MNVCEKSLEKCYGANLERLTLIQHENSNKYRPIFIRISLLKGILMYHKGKKMESKRFLDAANSELQKNVVDEEKVVQGKINCLNKLEFSHALDLYLLF